MSAPDRKKDAAEDGIGGGAREMSESHTKAPKRREERRRKNVRKHGQRRQSLQNGGKCPREERRKTSQKKEKGRQKGRQKSMKDRGVEKTMSIVTYGPHPSPWSNCPNLYSLMLQKLRILPLHHPQETTSTWRHEKALKDAEKSRKWRRRTAETINDMTARLTEDVTWAAGSPKKKPEVGGEERRTGRIGVFQNTSAHRRHRKSKHVSKTAKSGLQRGDDV